MADPFPALGEYVHDGVFLINNKNKMNCDSPTKLDDAVPNMLLQPITDNLHIGSHADELVDHVAIDVADSIDVPTNKSELVPHVARDVPELPNNNSSGEQDGNNGDWMHAALFGLADCATAIIALLNKPPSSIGPVYIVAGVIIFIAGVIEMLAARWVSSDGHRRRTAQMMILCTSIVTFIFGLVLDLYAYKAKK